MWVGGQFVLAGLVATARRISADAPGHLVRLSSILVAVAMLAMPLAAAIKFLLILLLPPVAAAVVAASSALPTTGLLSTLVDALIVVLF